MLLPYDRKSSIVNPFEEAKPWISESTAAKIATLRARLEKHLGPECVSAVSGSEKSIALANDVFGFNGWSSSIQNIQVDFIDQNPCTLKTSLNLSVIVRVTLEDGTYYKDIRYGHIEGCEGKAATFKKAKKDGTTDALKKTLWNFSNILENYIYNADCPARVTKTVRRKT